MTDLIEFLLARIAKDEADARSDRCDCDLEYGHDYGCPARVLAECAAKRRLLAMWNHDAVYPEMRVLATVYADHPDYREEWRP